VSRPGLVVRTPGIEYTRAWAIQRRLADARRAGAIPDVVWLLEHPPVFTTGRHGRREDLVLDDAALAARGATFHAVDRGGQMTWHGPGQTTAYVIADLRGGRGVRRFVGALVDAMNAAAAVPGAAPGAGDAGLYRDGRKLGSVGVRIAQGVSTHGVGLNRDPDLGWFDLFVPCGAPGVPATSIAAEGGDPERARVEADLAEALAERLGLGLTAASLEELVPGR
jgi:lipoate-protein ligase B